MTGIICDGNSLRFLVNLGNIVGKPLGRSSYHINIHTVGTCADDTTQACRTKLKIHIKTLFDLIFVVFDRFQFFLCRLIKVWVFKPLIIDFFIIHVPKYLPVSLYKIPSII